MKRIVNLIVIILFILLPVFVPDLRHSLYIGIGAVFVSLLTLSIWPYIAFNVHRTPLYVEDIEKTEDIKLIWWFKALLIVSTSIGLGLVVEFAWERFHNDNDIRLVEIAGVFGGLITLFSKIHMMAGKILLTVFGCIRKTPTVEPEY